MSGYTREGFGLTGSHMPDRGRLAGAATPAKDWVRHRAVRTCARAATSAAELGEFLAMLGLSPQEGR